jgi:hypothetical protein
MAQQSLIDPNLSKVLVQLAKLKKKAAQARRQNKPVGWLRPAVDIANIDITTLNGLKGLRAVFNTDKAEEALIKAATPGSIGNSSDMIVLPSQIDYMQQLERAYRARYQTFPRAVAHLAGRELGHGSDNGVIAGLPIRYFTDLISQGATGDGGAV